MNEKTTRLFADDLTIDLVSQQVIKQGHMIKLPDLSYRTLVFLLKNAPETVSIDRLMQEVWQGVKVGPDTVTQRIALLRKALSDKGNQNHKYIVSIRNKGYRFVPIVYEKKQSHSHLKVRYLALALLVSVIGVSIWWYNKDKQNTLPLTVIHATTQSEDFNQKGWRYIKKHDAKNNQLAIKMFEKSLQQQADNLDGLVGLSIALSHEVSKFNRTSELLTQAISLAKKASQLYPNVAKTWNALGFANDVKGDINTAISYYRKSLDLNPQRAPTLGAVAYLHGIQGELVKSLQMNLQLLNTDQEYTNLQVAQNLHFLGLTELAEQWYERADVLSPESVFASSERARFLISNQRYQEAKLLLDQAKSRGINRPEIHTLLGLLHLIDGNESLALNAFNMALTINSEDFEAQMWILVVSDNVEQKVQKLEELWLHKIFYWPSDIINKVILYAALGDRDKVIAGLEEAFNLGYMDSQWLLRLPPIKPYLSDKDFQFWINKIEEKADSQRQTLLTVNWLPSGFLDPNH